MAPAPTALITDLPHGPLTPYRKKASFDWKTLKLAIEGEESLEFKKHMVETLESDPLFARDWTVKSLDEKRALNHQRWKRIVEYAFVDVSNPYSDPGRLRDFMEILELYDQGLSGRYALSAQVFYSALLTMGTERHQKLIEQCGSNQIVGCFCLTEVSHGSNTANIGTTATFDNGEFRFDSPTEGSIKCWAGNLGQSATHAAVFAQLFTQGKCHGVHTFVLQVRDPKTLRPLPGINIGDMGAKPGDWNGVENGWMEFKGHRAPLSSLLNKGCDVLPTGEYVSSYKSVRERQSVSLGSLSVGRIGIIGKGAAAALLAGTISIRYSAVRRQFGPTGKEEDEVAVLEYPLQRQRTFPMIASAVMIRLFQKKLLDHFTEYMGRMLSGEKSEELAELSKEVHALSSCAKAVSTWMGVEALGEARRCCGGHGFLYSSRLNELRDSYDPSQTFEGENNILLQQTSNYLLAKKKTQSLNSPMGSANFLEKPAHRFQGWKARPVHDVLDAYKWLLHHLLDESQKAINEAKKKGADGFEARNATQVHLCHPLSIAFAEHTFIEWAAEFVEQVEDLPSRRALEKLLELFALTLIDKHIATLYIGGYTSGGEWGTRIRGQARAACEALKDDIIAIVDAVAPPDFLLNSALGMSDGRAYEHLMGEFRRHTDVRPEWWTDLAEYLKKAEKSKL